MSRSSTFAMTIAALSVMATPLTAVAAPYSLKSSQCYRDCTAMCAAQHSCERRDASQDCFTHYNQCKAVCRIDCSR
jgi:hypothetical protein